MEIFVNLLCRTIELKERESHGITYLHQQRVSLYAVEVGKLMALHPGQLDGLRVAALLHDIGKLRTPEHILNKAERLTEEEFALIKQHPGDAADLLSLIDFPFTVVPAVRHHHERWDGRGYPDGLSGYDIPAQARLLAVVDGYDACREDRPYRAGMSREKAVQVLREGRGTWYDPSLVDLFLSFLDTFEARKEERLFRFPPSVHKLSDEALRAMPQAGYAPTNVNQGIPEQLDEGRL